MKRFIVASLHLTILIVLFGIQSISQAHDPGGKIRVLTISGDWKSQPWYQDVWLQGRGEDRKGSGVFYRGRFIAREVERVAPGQFEFTDITNYQAQAYGDAAYFSQFDVIACGDVMGYSLSPRFYDGLKNFVQNGGGFLYAASVKWPTAMLDGTAFEEVLPARFGYDVFKDDWRFTPFVLFETNFEPRLTSPNHPIVRNLDWKNVPTLDLAGRIAPKDDAQVLVKSPQGAPLLVAWDFGKGRSALSASIFANDETSRRFGTWKDFGKYYAQMFGWLGENSRSRAAILKDAIAPVQITVEAGGAPKNRISAKLFSIHGAHAAPGHNPPDGEGLKNFQALHPEGGFARMGGLMEIEPQNDDDDPNHFNETAFHWQNLDTQLAQIKSLQLEPILLFEMNYGRPAWMWKDLDSTWDKPQSRAVAELAELVAATVEHANGGTGGDPNYKLNVRYIEIGNEPNLVNATIPGFASLVKGVTARIHRDYPGVLVGAGGNYEVPYLKQILTALDPDLDWVSRHPYGWTGERAFAWQDELTQFQKQNHLREIPFLITEWDFWIQGKPKFDYMMTRYFEAAKRENLLGTLHYRLWQYGEPTYLFGVLWAGWGRERGAGEKGTPMHDAYDALWLFRDFRGARVPVAVSTPVVGLADHLHADATCDGEKINLVLYYDWAYDGTGFKNYARGFNYNRAQATIKIKFPASPRARVLTVSCATGEGFETLPQTVAVAAGQTALEYSLDVVPTVGYSLTFQ
jgi:hypothetical protein